MFCPECGTQNIESAKFCINCGKNLMKVGVERQEEDIENIESHDEMYEEFKEQVIEQLVKFYINDEKIELANFYKKAKYYDVTIEQVDEINKQFKKSIEKLFLYMEGIYEEKGLLELDEEDMVIC